MKLSEKSMLDLFAVITINLPSLHTLILKDFFKSITQHISGARVGHALADLILQGLIPFFPFFFLIILLNECHSSSKH